MNEQRISGGQMAAALSSMSTLSSNEAERFVDTFFDVIRSSLVTDKIVKVRGLGTFKLVDVEARESVKVGTGERFTIEGHSKVTFTPDPVLRDAVNRPFADFETVVINEGVDIAALEAMEPVEVSYEDSVQEIEDVAPSTLSVEEQHSEEPAEQPVEVPVEESGDDSTEEAVDTMEEPIDTTEESDDNTEEPVDIPDEPVEETVEAPAEEPVAEPTEAPTEEPQDAPTDVTSESSFDDSEQQAGDATPTPLIVQPSEETDTAAASKSSQGEKRSSHVGEATVVRHADVVEVADYVRHSDKTSRSHRRWPGCLFGLFCLVLGYVIGCYFPVKMPTLVKREQVVNMLQYVNRQIDDFTSSLEAKQDTAIVDEPESKPDTPSEPAVTPVPKASAPAKPSPSPAASYPQLPGGEYEIVGVLGSEVMTSGRTLRYLSIKYYGSRAYVDYICVMNGITNPDIVPLNKELRIPKLSKK